MEFKLNIPNKITIMRIILIPLFATILLPMTDIPYKNTFAALLFGVLSVTDILDGYFARKKRQVSDFGKLLDPIADKLLILTALIFLIGKGVELWMAVVIIIRELVITAVRIYLLPSKIVVPASNFGRAKTVVQTIAIVFVFLELPLSWHLMFAAVLITVISGFEYIIRIKKITGNKLINLPNIITLGRFLLIMPFVYYFLNSRMHISLFIFAIITLSDKLDGISARLMNQKTELGSGLDSFTDWTLILTTFILLVIKNYIELLWVILLMIPSLVSGVMKMVYAKRLRVVPITFTARLSVGLTYVTIISILISFSYNVNFWYNAYLLTATIILVYLAMIGYIFKALNMPKKSANKKTFK